MTLIACAVKNNIPLLISDILLSSTVGTKEFRSPTNNFPLNQYLYKNAIYKPHSYAQKTYILKNNFCISLAGNVGEMEKLLKELRIKCSYQEDLTFDFVKRILEDYDFENEFKESYYGVLYINNQSPLSFNTWFICYPSSNFPYDKTLNRPGWEFIDNGSYGIVSAAGSGKRSFLNIVEQEIKVVSYLDEGSLNKIIQINVALIAKLLAFEKATISTLFESWGGGFETVVYDIFNMRLRKIDSIAYIIKYSEFDEEGDIGLPIPKLILYYKYFDDLLYIVGITINKHHTEMSENTITFISSDGDYEVDLFIIPPIDYKEKVHFDESTDLSFSTFLIALGYDLRKKNSVGTFNPSAFNFKEDELSISFKQGADVRLHMRKEINDELKAAG